MAYKSIYLQDYEVLPPSIYNTKNVSGLYLHNGIWHTLSQIIDDRVMETADQLREFFGVAITCNNYHNVQGGFYQRGYRTPDMVGTSTEPHRHGLALDLDFQGISASDARAKVMQNMHLFPYLTRLEKYATGQDQAAGNEIRWFHFDIVDLQPGQTRIHEFVAA